MGKTAEQIEKGWPRAGRKRKRDYRWWLKLLRKKAERRDAKRNLEDAAKRHTRGWEY